MSDEIFPEAVVCRNCGCPDIQRFCPRCGQEDAPSAVPVRQILSEFLADLLQFDAKIWVTLRLLIARPGFLTREYLDGRRTRYLSPLKLYLAIGFLSVLLHLAQPQRVEVGASGAQRSGFQIGYQMVAGWTPRRDAPPAEDVAAEKEASVTDEGCQQKLSQRAAQERQRQRQAWLAGNQSSLGVARIPLYALLFALFFRRQRRLYMEHLIFTLHLQSAVLLIEMAGRLVGAFLPLGGTAATLGALVYFYRAAQAMYGARGRIFWAMALFYGLTSAVDALAGVGAGIIYQLLPER